MDIARTLHCPPEVAWRALTDVATWPTWGPTVRAAELDADELAPGVRGRVRTPVGAWLPFEITGVVPGVSWHWRVGGIPATGHRVEPDPLGCRVVFEVPPLAAPYVLVCRAALTRLARLCEAPDRGGGQ